jgi:tetratricopeptide (TPR) repeat protein
MQEQNARELLAKMIEHQNKILEEIRVVQDLQQKDLQNKILEEIRTLQDLQKENKKDFWDVLAAVAPILAAVVIALGGTYFTWTYNQQQLKLQQIQTIEKFIPHLLGDEKSKRAAILAISSLGDDKLASRMASIFASPGTASALESIAKNTNSPDAAVVTNALYKTLDTLAQNYSNRNQLGDAVDAYKRAIQIKEQSLGKNSPELVGDLEKLAALCDQQGDHNSAQRLRDRITSLGAIGSPKDVSQTTATPSAATSPAPAAQPVAKAAEPEAKPAPEPPLPHLNAVDAPMPEKKAETTPEQKAPAKPATAQPAPQSAH